MAVNKNFKIRNGLEVADSLIFANANNDNVGIGTTDPRFTLEVSGDISLNNRLYTSTSDSFVKNVAGIVSEGYQNFILGINTSSILVGDIVSDTSSGFLTPPTRVVSIGNSVLGISPPHNRNTAPSFSLILQILREETPGISGQILMSGGIDDPATWVDPPHPDVTETGENKTYYPTFVAGTGRTDLKVSQDNLSFNPGLGFLKVNGSIGVNTNSTRAEIDVVGDVLVSGIVTANTVYAEEYYGDGVNLVGIVTNLVPGIGIDLFPTQTPGNKGEVTIQSYKPIGKTIFVSQTGSDSNTGLSENHPKRTIKSAAAIAFPGDTIKVYPGIYVEENPVYLAKNVSVEGTELRNCVVTPRYYDRDLFYVNNSCHITDLSFIGTEDMTDGAAVVSLQPLLGVAVDRYFDAARMIRYNLDYIAKESVGFLTSGFSSFAGSHREQDAARLIDLNLDFIASETVGFLTGGYIGSNSQPFEIVNSSGVSTDPVNCEDDIRDILRSISYDLKAGSNKKSIGAGLSYYDNGGSLLHITGTDTNGNSVRLATIDAINHAVGIVTYVINNQSYPASYTTLTQDTSSYSPVIVSGGCTDVIEKIETLSGIITSIVGNYANVSGVTTVYGVTLESQDCADDIKDIWKCIIHDITRGGNSRCVAAGKSYYDSEWNLIPQILKNPGEIEQTIATVDYSFNIARAVINNVTWGGFPVGVGTEVTQADYDNFTGITTITAVNHGLVNNDAVKIVGLEFTCPSGPGIVTYPSGNLGYIFNVHSVIDEDTFEVIVGQSTLPHTYSGNGSIQKYRNFNDTHGQLKDLGMQPDPLTGYNNGINGCANVVSALRSCVGVVTTIIGLGATSGISTTYPGNSGTGVTSILGVSTANYDNESGQTVITVPEFNVKEGDIVEVRNVSFACSSGGFISTQAFPSGKYGYLFDVTEVDGDSFTINVGTSTLPHTYAGNGYVVNRAFSISTATYENTTGIVTITAPGLNVRTGQTIGIRDLEFSCPSGSGTTTIYPTGSRGYNFKILDVVIDKPVAITSAVYDNSSGIVTITAPGLNLIADDIVEIKDLEFSCPDSPPNLIYPTGKFGYNFRVISSIGSTFSANVGVSTLPHTYVSGGTAIKKTERENDTFTIQVGASTIPHTYVSGGVAIPEYSPGVGPITQGPYVRNCTNFIAKSIGMKIDGFEAEPGDQDDIGVTGTMSVDSYTQYNQGGIGVSITNGAYAQLVSIFTICDDIAIYTSDGGQCDITNSNSSFGRLGLVSKGVGDAQSKSIYRYTGVAATTADAEQATIVVSGIANYRPYDGQALYFGELFYTVQRVEITNGGSGYTSPPVITFETPPPDVNGIKAEAIATIQNGSVVSIDLISTGTQYRKPPKIGISGGGGSGAEAVSVMAPVYYTIESATLPSAGVSTIILNNNLNSTVSAGTTVYFSRLSLQITSSHSFEWVGSGNDINKAKPALGGVVVTDNEVVKIDGGEVVYTSTDQAGNFRIGDGLVVNQLTGTVSGRAFSQSLINTVTPLIIALGK